jgi:hypothetical protein
MKSYFAKLADRATLANVPAPSSAYAPHVPDPFAEASPEQSQLPPLNTRHPQKTFHDGEGFALSPPVDRSRAEQIAITTEHKRDSSETPAELLDLVPKQSEQIVRYTLEPKESQSTEPPRDQAHVEDRVIAREVREVMTLLPNEVPQVPPPSNKDSSHEDQPSAEKPESTINSRVDEALLLRKADLFMGRLLDGTREKLTKVDDERAEFSQPITKMTQEPVGRLEPVQKSSPTPVHEPDGPSLVIGKLTVEIAPPTPPPVSPQPQRTIVRGPRGRGTGFMSNHRFGLGQF